MTDEPPPVNILCVGVKPFYLFYLFIHLLIYLAELSSGS